MTDISRLRKRMKSRLLASGVTGWTMSSPLPKPDTGDRLPLEISQFDNGSTHLEADERGAVWPIVPVTAFDDDGSFRPRDYDIPHEDIRSALMFFDKFDIPQQNMMVGLEWCEDQFRKVDVLMPSRSTTGGSVTGVLRNLPFEVFQRRDAVEPGRWTLARPAVALGFPEHLLQPSTAIAITLNHALPVFRRDVELEDVLEFKRRAWSELLALRKYLDELGADIARNGCNDVQQTIAYQNFLSALGDHIRRMGESNRDKVWHSFKASFDTESVASSGLTALFTGHVDLTAFGVGAAMIGIKTVKGLVNRTKGPSPFEYLTSANLEL